VQYLISDVVEDEDTGVMRSLGMKPIGCGGMLEIISQEEAMDYEPRE